MMAQIITGDCRRVLRSRLAEQRIAYAQRQAA